MAADEVLFEAAERGEGGTLRFYRWSSPTLSFGYAQRGVPVDEWVCNQLGVDLVRRITGGRMVLHGFDLTYALAMPTEGPFVGTIRSSCQGVGAVLQRGLAMAGVLTDQVPPQSGSADRTVCFAGGMETELYQNGRKLVGSAQKRGRHAFLQHGSIPLSDHYGLLRQILGIDEQSERWRSIRTQATWANGCTGVEVSTDRLVASLSQAFSEALKVDLVRGGYTQTELATIEALVVHRYATEAWNRGEKRCP